MLRKRQQNIFADKRRQVHAVIDDWGGFVALERDMGDPIGEADGGLEGFEAADALAVKDDLEFASDEQAALEELDFEMVLEGLARLDQLVERLQLEFLRSDLPFEGEVLVLEMTQVNGK